MSSEDKFTRSNSGSDNFTASPAAPAPASSAGPGQVAPASPEPDMQGSEEILRVIVDQTIFGFVKVDISGLITFANDRYCEITGYPREELLGRRWQGLTHPDDLPRNIEYYWQMMSNEKPRSFEKRYLRKNGETVWVNIDACRICNAGGETLGIAAFVVDITDRKHAETELIRAKSELEATLDAIPDLVFEVDLDGRYLNVHASRPELLAAPAEVLIGKLVCEILPPDAADVVMLALREAYETGRSYGRQIKLQVPQGTSWFELSIARKSVPAEQYPCFTALSHDITSRKQLEIKLRRSEENLNRAQAVGQIGSWVLDIPSSRLEWSAETYRIFGISPQQAIDLAIFVEGIYPDDRDCVLNAWGEAVTSNAPYDIEHRIVAKGKIRWVRERAHIERDPEGRPLTGIGTVQDVTERKMLEKEVVERRNEMAELQKLQVASQTAAAFAHELNQPLLAIASYSEAALILLRADNPNLDKARMAIEGSKRQAHRAGQSIRDMLEFLSLKEFPTEAFDLNKEIHAILDLARLENELEFHAVLRLEQALPLIRANRTHIQKAVHNLLRNCIEAMLEAGLPPPSIILTISTLKEESLAQMTIQDNGRGFSKEDIQHLFEPFFTTKARGIGMGLAISRSLIEANGGQLWVDPQEGQGATFHLTLPFAT